MRDRKIVGMFTLVLILCWPLAVMAADDTLFLITTKAAQPSAEILVKFLKGKDIPVKVAEPSEFDKAKKEKYITILCTMDESGTIRDIAKEALSPEEFQWAGQKGNGKMYVKSGVWASRQKVMLFVGSDPKATEEAIKAAKEDWMDKYTRWLEMEGAGGQQLQKY
jgi:hypothetical protein